MSDFQYDILINYLESLTKTQTQITNCLYNIEISLKFLSEDIVTIYKLLEKK